MDRFLGVPKQRFTGWLAAAAVLTAFACGGSPPAPAPSASPAAAATPAVFTAQQSVEWYRGCWELFNTKAWDTFQNCYTEDATSDSVDSGEPPAVGRAAIIAAAKATVAPYPDVRGELQLVLSNGPHLVSVALWKGTHTGPLPGPDGKPIPPMGKKIGFLMAHTVELNAARNTAAADASYVEVGTLLGQLGLSKAPGRKAMESGAAAPLIVIASDAAAEAKNVETFTAQLEAFNHHDAAAVEAFLADDYVAHEVARPKDENKQESLAGTKELFKGFKDVTLTTQQVFGAGDYVVAAGTFTGTNTGDMPSMGIKKSGKRALTRYLEVSRLANGKIAEDWLFYNGAAFAAQLAAK